ncbi:MAG: winged helix DNA-binding domain-containing protein [Thermoanaerobaculia bacterium]|nr:winged helix DNA-binding domain-containing protein [Thermoanaerobaculia bacterium]
MCHSARMPDFVSEEQVLYFRARRSGLAGGGAPDAVSASATLLGAQSQQLTASLLSLSQRCAKLPTALDLQRDLLETPRRLVRTWGQRDTLHIYAPGDWPTILAALDSWKPGGRLHAIPQEIDLEPARRVLERLGSVTRSDLESCVRPPFLRQAIARWGQEKGALRFAAGRLIWKLALLGEVSLTEKRGVEQVYAARTCSFPHLEVMPALATERAAADLAWRYLGVNGPATPHDMAHFFGANLSAVREWIASFGPERELITLECGGRQLLGRAEDLEEITGEVPPDDRNWPLRLLPMWDTLLMSHADKRWTVPIASEEKAIWRKAGVVAAVALHRGRVVATWSSKRRAKCLEVSLEPLSGWDRRRHLDAVEREARAVARHSDLPQATVAVVS